MRGMIGGGLGFGRRAATETAAGDGNAAAIIIHNSIRRPSGSHTETHAGDIKKSISHSDRLRRRNDSKAELLLKRI